MFLFKAVLMCQECGEIHGEKWLETRNRHASQTVIEMLCDSCKENEFDFDPFAEEFDPMESAEREHNGGDVCFLCTKPWNKCTCFEDDVPTFIPSTKEFTMPSDDVIDEMRKIYEEDDINE